MVGSMQTPIIPIGSGQTQELIAPVQDTLIAKQNYAEGQQFILGGALFTVTKSGGISVGDTINMNTDVEASDNITDQMNKDMSFVLGGQHYTGIQNATESDPYKAEYDGYLFVGGSSSTRWNLCFHTPYCAANNVMGDTSYHVFFIKKGMNLWFTINSSFAAPMYARFFPIK